MQEVPCSSWGVRREVDELTQAVTGQVVETGYAFDNRISDFRSTLAAARAAAQPATQSEAEKVRESN